MSTDMCPARPWTAQRHPTQFHTSGHAAITKAMSGSLAIADPTSTTKRNTTNQHASPPWLRSLCSPQYNVKLAASRHGRGIRPRQQLQSY